MQTNQDFFGLCLISTLDVLKYPWVEKNVLLQVSLISTLDVLK